MRANLQSMLVAFAVAACGPGQAESTETGTTVASTTTEGTDAAVTTSVAGGTSSGGSSSIGGTSGGESSGSDSSSGGDSSTGAVDLSPNLTYCPLDWPGSGTIAGTTPMGPFSGAYARFGWVGCYGYADTPELVILADETALVAAMAEDFSYYNWGARPFPALRFGLPHPDAGWETEGWTGETMWSVTLYATNGVDEEDVHQGTVTVSMSVAVQATVDPVEVPRIVGTLSVAGDGWDLAGTFDAAYCGALTWGHECG